MINLEKISQLKYSLKRENIFPLSEFPVSLGERKKSLGWPIEFQGTGRAKEGTRDFEVHYPLGDIFISFGIIIHELGHLRQEEFNSEITKIDKKKQFGRYIEAKEEDAYERGLKRLKEYFPEVLAEVESKFQEYKKQGKLHNFSSFEGFYKFLQGSIDINRALADIPETADHDEEDRLEYNALKTAGIENFFSDIIKSRVQEMIDKDWAEDLIMKMAEKIANE